MTGETVLPLPDPSRLDPAVLSTLLARHGWVRRGGRADRYARWVPPTDCPARDAVSLLVPAGRGFDDATDLLAEAVTALARSGLPAARSVLVALSVPGDAVHWRRDVPGSGGAVPWEAENALRGAAADMLIAAAKAGRVRAAYFGARLDDCAVSLLRQVLVESGSGAGELTAYMPAPHGRSVATTLAAAVEAVRGAVDRHRADGSLDAFDAAVRVGVSRELVGAVERLVRGSQGARIAVAWSPAIGPPPGSAARGPVVEFAPDDLPALRAATGRLERGGSAVEVRLTGMVVRLERSRADSVGAVWLRVLAGADVAEVRLRLAENAYRTAAEAHLAGVPLRLSGRLEREGGFQRLTGARGLVLCRPDEAEGYRLLRPLHERFQDWAEADEESAP